MKVNFLKKNFMTCYLASYTKILLASLELDQTVKSIRNAFHYVSWAIYINFVKQICPVFKNKCNKQNYANCRGLSFWAVLQSKGRGWLSKHKDKRLTIQAMHLLQERMVSKEFILTYFSLILKRYKRFLKGSV